MTIERCPVCGDLLLERHLHAETPNAVYGTLVNPTQVVHDDGTVEVERRTIITGDESWQCVVPGCQVDPYWEINGRDHACAFHLSDALEHLGAESGVSHTVRRISFLPTDSLEDDHAQAEGQDRAS